MKSSSFARRLTWWIVLALFVSITFVSILISFFGLGFLMVLTRDRYFDVIDETSETVQKTLTAVEIAVMNNVNEVEEYIDDPDMVFSALTKELDINKHLLGLAVAFAPDYYEQRGRWFEPYVARSFDGSIRRMQIGSANHDYTKSGWFIKGMQTDKGFWSDPYFDNAGAHAVLCSYLMPVHDAKGRTVGVFCADISLQWMRKQLQEIDKKNNERSMEVLDPSDKRLATYSFIVGEKGEYIVHPDQRRVLNDSIANHINQAQGSEADSLLNDLRNSKEGYIQTVIDGVDSYVFYSPLEHIGWSMAVVVPFMTMITPGIIFAIFIAFLMLLCLLGIFAICYFTIRKATRPLKQLAASAGEVAKGNFEAPLPPLKHNDEIGHLRNSFEDMQHSLAQYVEQLKVSTAQKASMESELNIARAIQMAMLPKNRMHFHGHSDIDISGLLTPAKAVGGDFYDYFVRNDHLFFCIGDVSGKGIPASLIMAVTSAQFRTLSETYDDPVRIVTTLNQSVAPRNKSNMFVTLFVGVFDLATGHLSYTNAGHDAPLIIAADGTLRHLVCDSNLPVGVMADWEFTLQHDQLAFEDILFLYTDGLTEAENKDQALFGLQRVHDAIHNLRSASTAIQAPASENATATEQLIEALTAAVHQYVDGAEQSDDLTMLAIQYQASV